MNMIKNDLMNSAHWTGGCSQARWKYFMFSKNAWTTTALWIWAQTNSRSPHSINWWLPETLQGSGTKCGGDGKETCACLPEPSTTVWISDQILGDQEMGDGGRVKEGTAQPTQELQGQRVKPCLQVCLKSLPNPGKSRASSSQTKPGSANWIKSNWRQMELLWSSSACQAHPGESQSWPLWGTQGITGALTELSADGLW